MYWTVTLPIHNAQNPQGFYSRIPELVRHHRPHVYRIVERYVIPFIAKSYLSASPNHNHAMLVLVLLEAGVAVESDLKVSNFELSCIGF